MGEKRPYKPRKPGGGWKKLKQEYDAGKNLKEQMESTVALYEEDCSLRDIADALNLNSIKVRKLLITAGVYEAEVAEKRGYNRRWQKARKSYLEAHPLCVECAKQGKYIRATVVDHIVPHRGNQKLFWDQNNWQALCKECHDRKTLTEDINPTYTY